MGVVSGIVMAYQFGTNWAVFSDKAGPVIGPLMAYEVLTAFFLEAGFLGVMLFGMERVGHKLHFAATLAVAAGTFISAQRLGTGRDRVQALAVVQWPVGGRCRDGRDCVADPARVDRARLSMRSAVLPASGPVPRGPDTSC